MNHALTLNMSNSSTEEQLHCFFMSGVSLPQDAVLHILTFVGTYDLTHSTSLVAKSWLAASRSTYLWHTLDLYHHSSSRIKWKRKIISELLKLLQRPQFQRLQRLTLPETLTGYYIHKTFPAIASYHLEQLEELDITYATTKWEQNQRFLNAYRPDDIPLLQLSELPQLFPRLTKLSVTAYSQHYCTLPDIVAFTKHMNARLKSIRIYDVSFSSVDDSVGLLLHVLAHHCPNLERMDYERKYHLAQSNQQDRIRERVSLNQGILKLLNKCIHLRTLCLINLPRHVNAVLEYLARNGNEEVNLGRLFIVSHFVVHPVLLDKVGKRMQSFEYISVGEHERRIQKRLPRQSRVYW